MELDYMGEVRRRNWSRLLVFGFIEFAVVFASLTIMQAAGLEAYAAFFAGIAAGVAAILATLVFRRS